MRSNTFLTKSQGFSTTPVISIQELIARKKELGDNVIPGSNSVMARNLNLLGHYYYDDGYTEKAEHMLSNMLPQILDSGQPNFYSNWCTLLGEMSKPMYEVAIVGKESISRAHEMQRRFIPNALYLGGQEEGSLALLQNKLQEGRTMIYVCQNKVCKLPVEESTEAFKLIN